MNDETVAFAMAQQGMGRQKVTYWACGLGILVCRPTGALLGSAVGSVMRDTDAFGFDAMFPAVIFALLLPALRDAGIRRPAILGAALAVLSVPFLPAGIPVLAALAGLVVYRCSTDATTGATTKKEAS